jgi:rfaE bifunctional protein kinase chain/domain
MSVECEWNGQELENLVAQLAGRRVMVIGDMIADLYVMTEPSRLSREAPVLVARYEGERFIPGGAANAVNNLLALGAEVLPVGVVGDDAPGDRLIRTFRELGTDTAGMLVDPNRFTTTKTRFMVGEPRRMKQQVLRVDRESEGPPSSEVRSELLSVVNRMVSHVDAVLLSDYGYGMLDSALCQVARKNRTGLVTVDSRYALREFGGVTLATPNQGEVEELLGARIRSEEDLENAGRALRRELRLEALVITRGNEGMSVFVGDRPRVDIRATGTEEVTDVSGAGDTVIAVTTLALAASASIVDAARLANFAAGVVVMKVGAATCSPDELISSVRRDT